MAGIVHDPRRFKTSPWFGRMVAHLSNSPDFVHVSFEKIMAEQELRDVSRALFHAMQAFQHVLIGNNDYLVLVLASCVCWVVEGRS